MKVCTDACIFGAYVAASLKDIVSEKTHVLDIGAGTGLLSLMIAQETAAEVDAIEIGGSAFQQARENFEASPWKERLQVFHGDVTQFNFSKKYDQIISNPPFFADDLISDNEQSNQAKHDLSLTLKDLVKTVNVLLKEGGVFWILLPFHRLDYFVKEAGVTGLYPVQKLLIRHSKDHPYFRGILALSKNKTVNKKKEFIIKTGNGIYTAAFIDLLGDYYLNL